ncbi:MAG TPA: nicotinate phosphoribosyltransferase, partial [Spirochaetales bacterium]|nr:nicotinate phosphoribosyltransferase [Spirochaetales bacterium]
MNKLSALFTDLYELTMAQGYFKYEMNNHGVFDMFFRRQPFGGGFSVFAGLEDLLEFLMNFRFTPEDLEYLEGLGYFEQPFLDYLASFHFTGDVYAVPEGTLVFPMEPLVRIHGTLIETQIIESMLLNILNFETLIATKSARIYLASNKGTILEFGLRRAQGPDGAMSASRAAYIGGASATSNTLAGRVYGIPVAGTMAHSWILAFDSEEEAFHRYAELYPNNTILLIDTFNTLRSGIANAIKIGLKLKALGKSFGVRLDSGDIQYLSNEVRAALDRAGLTDAKIAVSNELEEEIIYHLVSSKCPIDIWGVGTHLVTGGGDPAFTGVYKLCAREKDGTYIPTMKVSDNPEKSTNPGIKQVYRFHDAAGHPLADLIT